MLTRAARTSSGTVRQRQAAGVETDGFRHLWSALTIALLGAQVATLAIPLTAALTLNASPLQMGLLAAAGQAPFLFCSLPLGVWVDRANRRRPLLIGADLGRALLLATIPVAAYLDLLHMELLYGVAFFAGILTVLFEIAHYSYVPSLVDRDQLTAVNSRIQVSYSASDAAGPGLAGLLIQIVTAPFAVLTTATSFVISAFLLSSIKQQEHELTRPSTRRGFKREVMEGLRALLGHRLLRPIVFASASSGVFMEAIRAIYILYAARELGMGATTIGVVLAVGGAAAVPGGLLAGWAACRFGFGPTLLGSWIVESGALLLVALASGSWAILPLLSAQVLGGFAGAVGNVNQWTLRQTVTADHLQARVTASHRCLVYGAEALGAVLGGVLATAFGLRSAIVLCVIGAVVGRLSLLASPVPQLRAASTTRTDNVATISDLV